MSKNSLISAVIVLTVVIIIFFKEGSEELRYKSLQNNSTILAFGDSLTYGFGASKDSSYPAFMQKKTAIDVINAGVSGELSAEGLKRLPMFLKDKPDLVILCHGGNDILQKKSYDELKTNLLEMIRLSKESGAEVLLVGVPDFDNLLFGALEVYKEVAEVSGVMYEDEIIKYIELRRSLKSDYVHPNEKGYEMMADKFISVLKDNGVI